MDQQGAVGVHDLKKDRSQAQDAKLPPKPDFAQKPSAPQVRSPQQHAVNGTMPNGFPATAAPPTTTNGAEFSGPAATPEAQTPPELDQSWRQSDANKSMGTLIDRLAQQCFSDLSDTVARMSEMQDPAQSNQPNGVLPHTHDTSEASLSKKRTFMEFANGQRDRFIKTLVLSDWAKHGGEEMARLVDIKVWQEKQAEAQRRAINFIGITKNDTRTAKMPNPNIEGALELLATGKASKVPDLNYLPPKRLTAKQLLQTLRGMNVSLSTRLNLHEELPSHFDDFSVANGRATFRVPGEFEVDLSVADEEVSSPFYFIDIRFLFSPAPNLDERTRIELEGRANAELASKGLKGCYDFLHNFVLTHKINIVRDQAEIMHREKWFDCIRVERKNRVLTLQYWSALPGKKSWLEFGISTGKEKTKSQSRFPTPQLVVRWFRRGKLVESPEIVVDWQTIDVERMLSGVIAKHISSALSAAKDNLQKLADNASILSAQLQASDLTPENCKLVLFKQGLSMPMEVRIATITGHISLLPPTARATALQRSLNADPNADLAQGLATLLCKAVQDRIGKVAELAGWRPIDVPIRQDNLRSVFGADILSWKPYIPGPGWPQSWAICVTLALSGEKWWIVRLEDRPNTMNSSVTKSVTTVRHIAVPAGTISQVGLTQTSLLRIEKNAGAEVSFAVLSQELSSKHIQHRIEKLSPLTFSDDSLKRSRADSDAVEAMFFRHSALLAHKTDETGDVFDTIRLKHGGVLYESEGAEGSSMRHELRLSVDAKFKRLHEYLSASQRQDADIAMNANGALNIKLRTPFGAPFLEQIRSQLRSCARLDRCLVLMHFYKFKCTKLSLTEVAFIYSESPQLRATLTFSSEDGSQPATLKLDPQDGNPQRRIHLLLERVFNARNVADPFLIMCKAFQHTFHLFKAFDRIEGKNDANTGVVIHPRNPFNYSIIYTSLGSGWTFTAELRTKRDSTREVVVWKLGCDKTKQGLEGSDLGKALLELSKGKGHQWHGVEDGHLLAQSVGVEEAMAQLDSTVRQFCGGERTATKQESVQPKVEPVPPAANGQLQQNSRPSAAAAAFQAPPANMTAAANGHSATKVKKEVIELD